MEKVGGGILGPDCSEIPCGDGGAAPAATHVGADLHHPVVLHPQCYPDRLALAVRLPLLAVLSTVTAMELAAAYTGSRGKAEARGPIVDSGKLASDLGAAGRGTCRTKYHHCESDSHQG